MPHLLKRTTKKGARGTPATNCPLGRGLKKKKRKNKKTRKKEKTRKRKKGKEKRIKEKKEEKRIRRTNQEENKNKLTLLNTPSLYHHNDNTLVTLWVSSLSFF